MLDESVILFFLSKTGITLFYSFVDYQKKVKDLLIYTTKTTPRLQYIMQVMLGSLLGIKFSFTQEAEAFESYAGPKFSYARAIPGAQPYFASSGLLFEKGIGKPSLQSAEHQGIKVLFPVYDRNSSLPYDPFSAAFFMLTRYEEYLPYRKDQYGRFPATESLALKEGFLRKAVVNHWAGHVAGVLQHYFSDIQIKKPVYRFVPTYDIDQAWCYRKKGYTRTFGAYIRSLLNFDFAEFAERSRVLAGLIPDPFDTYEYQLQLQKKYKLKPVYFFLFARYGDYDKNIPVNSMHFRQLIKKMADYSITGIHPSYASNNDVSLLRDEIKQLSAVLNREIIISRQHFLKLHLPETYRNLVSCDISADYTMGFAALPGFRAGIAMPYQFYDIDLETTIPLTVFPFAVMDGTLRDYMKLNPEQASVVINELIAEVKSVGGVFSSLWHNDSLSEAGRWKGWRKVYEELVENAAG